jgi:hypothetical protein
MSEKGKNPKERSKGASQRTQREQEMRGERTMGEVEENDVQDAEALREIQRKPNRK